MRSAALVLALSMTACFPHNARHRSYAKLGEGAALAAGIAMLYFAGTGADCDQMRTPGIPTDDCDGDARIVSSVGLGLILAGLSGFIATVSTAPDDDEATPPPARTTPRAPLPTATTAPTPPAPAP